MQCCWITAWWNGWIMFGGSRFRQGWLEGLEQGAQAESWINCFQGHAVYIIHNDPYCTIFTSIHHSNIRWNQQEDMNTAALNWKSSVCIVELETHVWRPCCTEDRILMRFSDWDRDKQVGLNIITRVNIHFLFLFAFLTYFEVFFLS